MWMASIAWRNMAARKIGFDWRRSGFDWSRLMNLSGTCLSPTQLLHIVVKTLVDQWSFQLQHLHSTSLPEFSRTFIFTDLVQHATKVKGPPLPSPCRNLPSPEPKPSERCHASPCSTEWPAFDKQPELAGKAKSPPAHIEASIT